MKKENYNLSEIESIKDWCNTIINFMSSLSPSDKVIEEFQPMKEVFKKHYRSSNKNILKGVTGFVRIMNDWASQLPHKEYLELNKILFEKFGKGLEDVNKETTKRIAAITKRGKIINDEEYRILDERINELCQASTKSSEIKILNKLLFDYHQKK